MSGEHLHAALGLAKLGIPCFPVWPPAPGGACSCVRGAQCDRPAKHPVSFMARRGFRDASLDPAMLRDWWARPEYKTRRPWNVAAAVPASWCVVDLDTPTAAEAVHAQGWTLPATATVKTARGRHYWYTTAELVPRAVGVLSGVDVCGPGGYVLCPPSLHASGARYEWEVPLSEAAEAPSWLYELARPVPAAEGTREPNEWGKVLGEPVPEGQRNGTAAKVAGLLFRRLPAEAAWPMLDAWNVARCRPPLDGDELAHVAASIAARELARRGGQ